MLQTNYEKLDFLASKEPVQKKKAARYKVDQVKHEINGISAAVNNIQMKLTNKWRVAAQREELLTQRYTFGFKIKNVTMLFAEFVQQKRS